MGFVLKQQPLKKISDEEVLLFSAESGAQCKFKLNFLVFAFFPPRLNKTTKNYVFIFSDWNERQNECERKTI